MASSYRPTVSQRPAAWTANSNESGSSSLALAAWRIARSSCPAAASEPLAWRWPSAHRGWISSNRWYAAAASSCRPELLNTQAQEIGYFFFFGPQLEGDVGAFGGMLVPSAVQQGFAEAAKEDREFIFGKFVPGEIDSARLDEIRGGAQWPGNAYRLCTNFIEIGH